ncbi:MAG TPA: hypothetical protein VKT82_09710 [Ktedonobacterales bacterium]|nr:hypothetical protein [Ktedonobacterales bacterium]
MVLSSCSTTAAPGGSNSPVAGGSTPTPGGSVSTPGEATATPGPAPTACVPHTSATAEAWVSGTSKPQVMGSINGAAETKLSNFGYPLGLPNEGAFGNDYLAALAWAPDAHHLAVAVGVDVGPGQTLFPYVVDTSTHAVTQVKLPGNTSIAEKGAANRIFAWADNHTLLIFGGFSGGNNGSAGTVSYSYDISAASLTPLPGVTTAYEGVVRCSTLFYLEVTALTQITVGRFKGAARLHRYDLTSHSEIGSPVTLGDTSTFSGAEGDVSLMGWDVSPDGTHIAYQQTRVSLGTNGQIVIASKFLVANADGSGASAILTGATSNTPAFLAISPDGKQVAVTNAQPTPEVFSGSMSGGAAHFYQPDAEGPPVWLAGSAQFEADNLLGSSPGIELWALNSGGGRQSGSIVHPGGGIPATLP